jgi:hypothetical protein
VPLLRDTLRAHRNTARYVAPDDPVFPNSGTVGCIRASETLASRRVPRDPTAG